MDKYIEILYKRQKKIIEEKRQEENRIWCGREKDIELIEEKLRSPRSKTKPVFNIYGPASIGKSRILKQFREKQDSKFRSKNIAYIDFFSNYRLQTRRVSFLYRIVNDWDTSQSLFSRFRSNGIRHQKIMEEQGEKFKQICQKEEILRKGDAITSNKIINIKLVEELIRHNFESEEVEFILNYSHKQEEIFFQEVENIYLRSKSSYYENVIILDDLDLCGHSIMSLVKDMIKKLGNKVLFIIATSDPLFKNTKINNDAKVILNYEKHDLKDYEQYVEYLNLEKIKPDNIVKYLTQKEIYDTDIQDMIIDISCGFPFLMDAILNAINLLKKFNLTMPSREIVNFFTVPNNRELNDEFEIATFIMQKLNEVFTLYDRRLKDVLYRLAIPRFFNEEVLFLIAESDDEKIAKFFVNLAGMVFISPGFKEDGNWKYHDLMRNACLKLCEGDIEKQVEIHGKLYRYFSKDYPLESIYHLYQIKPLKSMGKIIDLFNNNLQNLKTQRASDILNDFFSYFTVISSDTEIEEKGLIYSSIANMFMNLPGDVRVDNIENTITAYDTALKIYDEKSNAISYGATLRKLGDACFEVYLTNINKSSFEYYLNESIKYYEKAGQFFPSQTFALDFANLEYKKGIVLSKFKNSNIENIFAAINCFESAQKIFQDKNLILDIAKAKIELGNVFIKLAEKENRTINLNKAEQVFIEAVEIFEKENLLIKAAEIWKNIGITYYKIEEDRNNNLTKALDALHKALAIFNKENYPKEFIEIKKYLGLCYYYIRLGDQQGNIEKALKCFKEALDLNDSKKYSEDYAQLNLFLGNTYARLQFGDRTQNLEQALNSYLKSLQIYDKNNFPREFADILNNQGMIYLEFPTGNHKENIKKAIDLFKKALEIRTKSLYPEDYAYTQMNMGSSYQELMIEDEEYIKDAINAYNEAQSIYNKEKYSLDYAMINNNLGNIYEKIAIKAFKSKDFDFFKNYISRSFNCYKTAMEAVNSKSHPQFFDIINKNLNEIKKVMEKLSY